MILCYELVYSFLSISIVMEFDVVKKIESVIARLASVVNRTF